MPASHTSTCAVQWHLGQSEDGEVVCTYAEQAVWLHDFLGGFASP